MPAREEVNVRMTAEDAALVAAWQRARQGPSKMGEELKRVGQKGKQAGNELKDAFVGAALKFVGVQAAISAATGALRDFMQAAREERGQQREAVLGRDLSFRRLRVQARLTDEAEAARAKETIERVRQEGAVTFEQAAAGATQLISSGFERGGVLSGETTKALIDVAAASNAARPDADFTTLARSLGLFLNATNQPLNTAGLQRAGRTISNLFETTNIQIADLDTFAAKAITVTEFAKLRTEEILSAFSILRDVTDPSSASTQFAGTASKLATAGGNKRAVKALATIGLTPEELSATDGKTFVDVLNNLKRAAEKHGGFAQFDELTGDVIPGTGSAVVNTALKRLVGEENLPATIRLMQKVDEIERRMAVAGDESIFRQRAGIAQTGPTAQVTRAEEDLQRARDLTGRAGTFLTALKTAGLLSHEAPFVTKKREEIFQSALDLGVSPERAKFAAGPAVTFTLNNPVIGPLVRRGIKQLRAGEDFDERLRQAEQQAGNLEEHEFVPHPPEVQAKITAARRARRGGGEGDTAAAIRELHEEIKGLRKDTREAAGRPQKITLDAGGPARPGHKSASALGR